MTDLAAPSLETLYPTLAHAAQSTRTRRQPLILIVDDDPVLRDVLQLTLEDEGFTVASAEDGAQGLARFASVRPDAVITDANMPVMDGFALCEALRTLPAARFVPIMMLTAANDAVSIRRAFTAGATDFATKPLQEELVGHRLRYLLQASQSMLELARSEARLANAQRIGRIGSWELEVDTDVATVSDEVCRLIGIEPAQRPHTGLEFLGYVHPEDRAMARAWAGRSVREGRQAGLEYRVLRPDGCVRHAYLHAEIVKDATGLTTHMTGIIQDITERKEAEERIRYLAMHDGLTGLPNRRHCAEQLEATLARAARSGKSVAVMIIGLDGFKRINEAHGNGVGDALLRAIGERLKRGMRQGDHVARDAKAIPGLESIARLGSDTFTVTLTELERAEDAAGVAARIQQAIADPCPIGDRAVFITASIGIAAYPADGGTPQDLLKNAESAMHVAKMHGHNGLRFFAAGMNAGATRKLLLANAMRTGVGTDQFRLVYQPQVEAGSGRIFGAEALTRWNHPEIGAISPAEFIPLAEELGLITRLGEWAMQSACTAARAWQDGDAGPLCIAVNVSPKQFREPGFAAMVARVLATTGLEPHCLELEVTEGVMVGDTKEAIATMQALRQLGVQLAIDDFGTGYSSLSYLKQFPIQRLKIDQSFVRELDRDTRSGAIAHAVIVLGHALGLRVIAEGVETAVHAARLRELGCDELQGYLIAKPLPPQEFAAMVAADWRLAA